MDDEMLVDSLDCTAIERAVTEVERLLRETETVEAQLCVLREENEKEEEEIRKKSEESAKIRRLCEAALDRKHERLQTLRQISQLRQSRHELNAAAQLASHATQQEIISLQAQYNSLVETRNRKQALLTAAHQNHVEELHRLQEELRRCKGETEEKFKCTTRAQEAVVVARQERDRLSRELQYAFLRRSEKNKSSDSKGVHERQQQYNTLLERIKQAEQKKRNSLLASNTDASRILQFPPTRRTQAAPSAPRCSRILSELIEDAGKAKTPPRVNYHPEI